jgi:hypothetical protein
LAETFLLGERTALVVNAADSHPHAAGGFDVEIQARTIQNIVTAELILVEFDATGDDVAVPMHQDQANLIRTIGPYRRSTEEGDKDGSTHQGRPNSSKD